MTTSSLEFNRQQHLRALSTLYSDLYQILNYGDPASFINPAINQYRLYENLLVDLVLFSLDLPKEKRKAPLSEESIKTLRTEILNMAVGEVLHLLVRLEHDPFAGETLKEVAKILFELQFDIEKRCKEFADKNPAFKSVWEEAEVKKLDSLLRLNGKLYY